MTTADHFALIVAGGSGTRMKGPVSKQFMLLWDKPMLMHTLANFAQSKFEPEVILVLPQGDLNRWEELSQEHSFHETHLICRGGSSRAESVYLGLSYLETNFPSIGQKALVAVHDGVRPLASPKFIDKLYKDAGRFGNAVPVLPCRESVRMIKHDPSGKVTTSKVLDRDDIKFVQTPQVFRTYDLISCYRAAVLRGQLSQFTDDASLVESCGYSLHYTEGAQENIKITYPDDVLIAEALMGRK